MSARPDSPKARVYVLVSTFPSVSALCTEVQTVCLSMYTKNTHTSLNYACVILTVSDELTRIDRSVHLTKRDLVRQHPDKFKSNFHINLVAENPQVKNNSSMSAVSPPQTCLRYNIGRLQLSLLRCLLHNWLQQHKGCTSTFHSHIYRWKSCHLHVAFEGSLHVHL